MVLDVKHLAEVLFGPPADTPPRLSNSTTDGLAQPRGAFASESARPSSAPADSRPRPDSAPPSSPSRLGSASAGSSTGGIHTQQGRDGARPWSGSGSTRPSLAEPHALGSAGCAVLTAAPTESRDREELQRPASAGLEGPWAACSRDVRHSACWDRLEGAAQGVGRETHPQVSAAGETSAPEKSLAAWLDDL